MNANPIKSEILFSIGAVEEELERIFHDPHFTESVILKKFLSFIVQETILGRSNCLKEYTIAINVLQKPLTFNPQENCIVRIHAGRLRRALNTYYNELGKDDQIVITIPKGKYVPVFSDRQSAITLVAKGPNDPVFASEPIESMVIAILPFNCSNKEGMARSFSDGLCMQIGSMLMRLNQVSIIAHQAIKNLVQVQSDYKELNAMTGVTHIITGGLQFIKNKLRGNIQLIDCTSYKQLWSETYERKLTRYNYFDIQDEVAHCIVSLVDEMTNKKYSEHEPAVMRVSS